MRSSLAILVLFALLGAAPARSPNDPPLLPVAQAEAIAAEVSGSQALRTVHILSVHHRMRVSDGYRAAAESIMERLAAYGLDEAEMIRLPADGEIFYGTQRSRPAWNASFAELWEQSLDGEEWRDSRRIASWAEQPISLAQDSVSGAAEAILVDIGAGTSPSDYQGVDLRGKFVLTSSQPEAVADLAVGVHGAAGIISWAQNQRTAWWGEDESLIRWGHLDTFGDHPTFAFMVSPEQARHWQQRLRSAETVRLRARVEAGRSAGAYLIPTAVIPGVRRDQEIVYSCHLDHPSPGANDNASGCAGILEVARTLNRLIDSGALPSPERTLRFIWPPEVEGTIALLNARPEFRTRSLATIHLDMIGGDTEVTKSILRVEGSPPSLPSFVGDVGFAFADYVNDQSMLFASTGEAKLPLIDPQGSRRALQAEIGGFSQGSDHQVWAEGSFRIPVIYIADWPDRYIHTQRDVPGNLDPTKMRRAIFIAAASGFYLANFDPARAEELRDAISIQVGRRSREAQRIEGVEADLAALHARRSERLRLQSIAQFGVRAPRIPSLGRNRSGPVYRRIRRDGPMEGFGYSWLDDQLSRLSLSRPRLLDRPPPQRGASFAYEALNLVDGSLSTGEIHDLLSASVGPVPAPEVNEFLAALARLGVVEATGR